MQSSSPAGQTVTSALTNTAASRPGPEQRYYTVPWPVADYDTCPSLDS
jgi:hypothetical protein